MNIGVIVKPNQKGQIVIPKEIRDELDIKENTHLNIVVRGEGIYIYPAEEVLTRAKSQSINSAYLEIIKQTQGILSLKPYYKNQKARRKLELAASRRLKTAW